MDSNIQPPVQPVTPPTVSPPPASPTVPPPPPPSSASSGIPNPSQPVLPPKKSSHAAPIIALTVVLLLVGAGVWFYQTYMVPKAAPVYKQTQPVQPSPTAIPSPTLGPVKSGDSALDQQSDEIDASMDKLNSDVTNVDKGLQDTSVDLN